MPQQQADYSDKLGFYHLAVESKNKLATICCQTGPKDIAYCGNLDKVPTPIDHCTWMVLLKPSIYRLDTEVKDILVMSEDLLV